MEEGANSLPAVPIYFTLLFQHRNSMKTCRADFSLPGETESHHSFYFCQKHPKFPLPKATAPQLSQQISAGNTTPGDTPRQPVCASCLTYTLGAPNASLLAAKHDPINTWTVFVIMVLRAKHSMNSSRFTEVHPSPRKRLCFISIIKENYLRGTVIQIAYFRTRYYQSNTPIFSRCQQEILK